MLLAAIPAGILSRGTDPQKTERPECCGCYTPAGRIESNRSYDELST